MTEQQQQQQHVLPFKAIVAVGTYEGVLAGWEIESSPPTPRGKKTDSSSAKTFRIAFASPVHGGSVRSLCMSSKQLLNNNNSDADEKNANNASRQQQQQQQQPGLLVSAGYDEMLKTHDLAKRLTSAGEVRTPADFGTPVCSQFAPPPAPQTGGGAATMTTFLPSTHCLVGFSTGKLVIYKKRDWSVQHVLPGHEGGMACLSVHPTGKMALSGGLADGKIKLWDLTKGRLAYNTKITPASTSVQGRTHYDPVVSLVWSRDGTAYAFCHGSHVTVRDVGTGRELLDVDLPSRVNQICLMQKQQASGSNNNSGEDDEEEAQEEDAASLLFVAAACNDGSLPVLAVNRLEDCTEKQATVRAIMAIEPVDGPVAGEERFKCIQSLMDYYVVTANSAGVVSLMNLQGAVQMILQEEAVGKSENNDESSSDNDEQQQRRDEDEEQPVHPESDVEDDDDDDDDDPEGRGGDTNSNEDLAVDIIDSVRLGTGARITCLSSWCAPLDVATTAEQAQDVIEDEEAMAEAASSSASDQENPELRARDLKKRKSDAFDDASATKRKREHQSIDMDADALEKARKLVSKAKKIQKRKEKKKKKHKSSSSKSSA